MTYEILDTKKDLYNKIIFSVLKNETFFIKLILEMCSYLQFQI